MIRSHQAVVLGVATIASLAACRVGPNYQTPVLPRGTKAPLVSLNTAAETPTPPPDAWWRLYDDSRLDALVQEALQANRTLVAAEANFAAARAAVSAVHAERYPTTSAVAGGIYGRDATTDEILELTGRPPQTTWLFEDIFQAAYEVDLFGRVHRAIEAANANAWWWPRKPHAPTQRSARWARNSALGIIRSKWYPMKRISR
jgi:outer membrane protein, multidrug efflux system